MKEDENRIDSWQSQLYFCLMSNFGSYVKALRKASTHLTEEPFFLSKLSMFYVEKVDDEGENLMLVLHLINLCSKCKRLHEK